MPRLLSLLLLLLTGVQLSAISVDDVPNVHIADRSRYVSDPAGILSQAERADLDARIAAIWRDTSAEVVVVLVDQIDPSLTPEEFATRLFEKWGIGKRDKDNGLLILVSRDDHAAQIRTGYGLEGALPDVLLGRLLRGRMFPRFRNGEYALGIGEAIDDIGAILRNPAVADEVLSDIKSDSPSDDLDGAELFRYYLYFSCLASLVVLILIVSFYFGDKKRKHSDQRRWQSLQQLWIPVILVAFATIGIGVVGVVVLKVLSSHIRRHNRSCPNCHTRMRLIDEVNDNKYLTPYQDLEEQLKSVDYDVWECPSCHLTDILPYPSATSQYEECPNCHTRALSLIEHRILRPATVNSAGNGVDIYLCRACGYRDRRQFSIPRKQPAVVIVPGGGSGGGFSGGSFGGGLTGGGGAGGRW